MFPSRFAVAATMLLATGSAFAQADQNKPAPSSALKIPLVFVQNRSFGLVVNTNPASASSGVHIGLHSLDLAVVPTEATESGETRAIKSHASVDGVETAKLTGTISGTTLTVTSLTGLTTIGEHLSGQGVDPSTVIVAKAPGANGSVEIDTVSLSQTITTATNMTATDGGTQSADAFSVFARFGGGWNLTSGNPTSTAAMTDVFSTGIAAQNLAAGYADAARSGR